MNETAVEVLDEALQTVWLQMVEACIASVMENPQLEINEAFMYANIIDATQNNRQLGDVLADYLIDNARDFQLIERLTQSHQQGTLLAFKEQIKQYLQSLSGPMLIPAMASEQALGMMPRFTSQGSTMVLEGDFKFSA